MKHVCVAAALAFALALTSSPSAQGALIDNPQYTSWAKQKPGAELTYQTTMTMPQMSMSQDVTHVLKSVDAEKAVVEITTVMNMGGYRNEQKMTREIPAKIEESQQFLPPEVKGEVKKVGNETLKIAGGEYACEVWEFTGEAAGSSATGKIWRSDKVPGGMVQTETGMQTPMGAGTSKMVLKSITP